MEDTCESFYFLIFFACLPYFSEHQALSKYISLWQETLTRILHVQNHSCTLCRALLTKIVLSSFVHAGPKNITNPV